MGHPLEQCVVFRRLFDEKLKAGDILFQKVEPQKSTTCLSGDIKTDERVM